MAAQAQAATRKQLDELDALLQKMLGQPATSSESPNARAPAEAATNGQALAQPNSPPRPPQFPPASVAYGVPPAVAFAASSPASTAQENEKRPGWSIDLNPRDGSSVLGGNRAAPSVDNVPPSSTNDRPSPTGLLSVKTIPNPDATTVSKPVNANGSKSWHRVPTMLRPIAWFSERCDVVLQSCGPIGRMFMSPAGRTIMGYVGLAMLAASVASGALAWIGWSW